METAIYGTGTLHPKNRGGKGVDFKVKFGNIVINGVDKSQVSASDFVANPAQPAGGYSSPGLWAVDVNYTYNGPLTSGTIPQGNDYIIINTAHPSKGYNPEGGAIIPEIAQGGTIYVRANGSSGNALLIGRMIYTPSASEE